MVLPRLWRCLKRTFQFAFGGTSMDDDEHNANNCVATQFPWEDSLGASDIPPSKRVCLSLTAENETNNLSDTNFASLLPLKQLLTCNVCFEFAKQANQCANGHLICLSCSTRLEQVSFSTKDCKTSCTCPICRVSLRNFSDGRGMQRCLLAEKLAAELPVKCRYCKILLPRKLIDVHQRCQCSLRLISCRNAWLGCDWRGFSREMDDHVGHCRILEQTSSDLVKEMYRRMQDIFSGAAVRLHPWRGLLQILEDRQQLRFGRRFHGGFRVVLLPISLDRVHGEGNGVLFSSPPVCMPLVRKQSLWVQMSIEILRNGPTPTPSNAPSEVSYKIEIKKSKAHTYLLRSNTEESLAAHPVYFSLISLKCESLHGCEEGVDLIDPWHRYIDEPSNTLSESSEAVTDAIEINVTDNTATSAVTTTLNASRNKYRIITLPDSKFNHLWVGRVSSSECLEWIAPEFLSTRDSVQAALIFALDPILFDRKGEKSVRTATRRRRRRRRRESQREQGESSTETTTSSTDEDEEEDIEVEEEEGENNDDETIYILAESVRASRENATVEGESNASAEPAVSSETES
ncbi:Cysteine and histidine-rich protein [Echinococcus granulosus]|uniref:Cysteine and histidine-rich protein n=2 Tax=Echinococcus granulosus TaxID=6210 RepID=W6UEP0_ECHGR|nr:Cysteine and histidine-rich protein [Echinococcus granulosus]EUB59523.1 Cysteine and histidine-rich protein [Echinococcus granulosus]